MADDPRVRQLLDELLNSQATPEEVCASCPELLPQLRARWRIVRSPQGQCLAPSEFQGVTLQFDTEHMGDGPTPRLQQFESPARHHRQVPLKLRRMRDYHRRPLPFLSLHIPQLPYAL